MTTFDQLDRIKRLVVLGAILCATVVIGGASAAGVGTVPAPDVFERYAAAHGSASAPDLVERYAAVHRSAGTTLAAAQASEVIRDDWFRRPAPNVASARDLRVDDWFRDAPTVVAASPSDDGLDWGAFGIGAGAMLGLTVLLTGLGLGTLAIRQRASKLETS